MLCLDSEEGAEWPPYPAETVAAELIGPAWPSSSVAPWFATGVSAGDVVQVRHDGTGWVGRPGGLPRWAQHRPDDRRHQLRSSPPTIAALRALGHRRSVR